ncbi:MAG: hypothetical protein JSS36_09800 [Proteobacteria bacterium]|nr:hypothetical protein [Pseudomonadota bacterium]
MQLHTVIAALRGDDTPQRQAQAAMAAGLAQWQGQPGPAAVLAGLAACEAGAEPDEVPALARLIAPGGTAAADFARHFCAAMAGTLDAAPLGHVPLRHFTDGANSTLLLARHGAWTLMLVALDAAGLARKPAPRSVTFSPTRTWDAVVGGAGEAERVVCTPLPGSAARLEVTPARLTPGVVLARDGRSEALVHRRIEGRVVVLRLQQRLPGNEPLREYDLASGALIHRAAGSPLASRYELMANLLGRMGRADAAPALAQLALEPGAEGMRWQALRECLGLDSAAGFTALSAIARQGDDPLALPAGALRAQLLETHPQLEELAPCPA